MTIKISIRIPTLNNYERLIRALESISSQDFNDKDIIIVDNNSDDGSWELTQTLPKKYPGTLVLQNHQRGLVENWNYCIKCANSQYVLIFHHDDIMLPGMLEKSISFLDKHPSVGLVHTNCYDVTEKSKQILRITGFQPVTRKGTEALMKIAVDCNIACSTVVVRKECYDKLGLFTTGNPSPDAEMWARIVKEYDLGHIDEPLVKVTLHNDSYGKISLSQLPPAVIEAQWRALGDKIISYFPPEDQLVAIGKSKISGLNALSTAAYIAWCQKRWFRGHQFMILAARYSTFHHFLLRYIINLLKSFKYILFDIHNQHKCSNK
jgi:glycosyltransferase involved in cell wall biosynthesis